MDKYLLDILKEQNTIIIPGFGALTITNTETGETMFMPYLQHDDGKMAAFVAEKDGLEEADARIMVGRYVREIQATLSKGEPYAMFQLGTFTKAEDGEIEYAHWENLNNKKQAPVTPVAEEQITAADQSTVEPVIELEPEVIPEPTVEVEPVIEPEPEVIPEPIAEPEPVVEPEPEVIPEPVVEVEPVVEPIVNTIPEPEPDVEEIKIKKSIEEALGNTAKIAAPIIETIPNPTPEVPREVIHESTLEPSTANENSINSAPIDEKVTAAPTSMESEEIEEKDKPTAKFWIYLILIAILIIGGGAYIGRNYNELKQHVPFLADKKPETKAKPVLDEMDELIKSGQDKQVNDRDRIENDETDRLNENDAMSEGDQTDKTDEDKAPVNPEPVVQPEPRPTPIATSSGGHYHVIAGAFSSEENANNLAKEFKAKGLASSVIKNGELNAVSMQSYATSAEANAALPQLKEMNPGAWILYK